MCCGPREHHGSQPRRLEGGGKGGVAIKLVAQRKRV